MGDGVGIAAGGLTLALPDGEVRVLDGQFGQVVGQAAGLGGVRGGQVAQDDAEGPAVADQMVGDEQQAVAAVVDGVHRAPQQRPGRRVEGAGRVGPQPPRHLVCRDVLLDGEVRAAGGGHELGLGAVGRGAEDGAQRLVAGHEGVERARERAEVEGAVHGEGRGHVVLGGAGVHPVEDQKPALGVGDGELVLLDGHRGRRVQCVVHWVTLPEGSVRGPRRSGPPGPGRAPRRGRRPVRARRRRLRRAATPRP